MMSTDGLEILATVGNESPTAMLTTLGANGLRQRRVHPLWGANATSGFVLTDGKSPKVRDLARCSRVTMTHSHDGLVLFVTVDTTIGNDPLRVAGAISECVSRRDGYDPADFWTPGELQRLVVVELSPTAIDVARFNGPEVEISTWRTPMPTTRAS